MERIVKGIYIPLQIWQADDLGWNEKILLMEIDSFTTAGRDCYFSNEYIADLLKVKPNTASILVSSLIKKGYVKMSRFDGRRRFLESRIKYTCDDDAIKGSLSLESKADFDENQRQTLKSVKHTISNKRLINNTIKKESKERFIPPTVDEVRAYCAERCNTVDAEAFVAFYASKGWKVGTSTMKDWRAAVITWEKREKSAPALRRPSNYAPDDFNF